MRGANPYAAAPLYACESIAARPLYQASFGVALPAPLPGYALLPFALLSFVPILPAAALWGLLLVAACVAAVRSLRELGVDSVVSVAAGAFALGVVTLPFGELVPIALASYCACAAALRRGSYGAAVAWACIGMIEPHVGLAVLLVLVGLEATRLRAASAIVLLAVLHALVVRDSAVTYFSHVLAQHALAELTRSSQYSLSWALRALGMSAGYALGIGSASYALALGLGISLAAVAYRRTGAVELLALVPAPIAIVGGTFMHLSQTGVAVPAALVLYSLAHGRAKSLLGIAVLLLAIPWNAVAETVWFVPLAALASGLVTIVALDWTTTSAMRATLVVTVYCAALALARAHVASVSIAAPPLDPALAQARWGAWIAANDSYGGYGVWLAKAPTWIALVLVGIGAAFMPVRPFPPDRADRRAQRARVPAFPHPARSSRGLADM